MKLLISLFALCSFLSLNAREKIALLDVEDLTLTEVIRVIAEDNTLNIVPSIKARNTKVNIYLKNIDPIVALEEICSSHNLWLKKDAARNIYRIYSLDEYKRSITNSWRPEQAKQDAWMGLRPASCRM